MADEAGRAAASRAGAGIDARVKLVHVLVFGILLFVGRSGSSGAVLMATLVGFLVFVRLPKCALKLVLYYGALWLLGWVLSGSSGGGGILGTLALVVFLLRKLAPLLGLYYLFAHAIGVSELVRALSAWRFPRNVMVPLAVALRFFPTIGLEAGVIKDVLRLRGRPLTLLTLCRAPREMLEYAFVPFMMRCVQIADELSASAVARGIENPEPRTALHPLKLRARDGVYLGALAVSSAAVVACGQAL